MQHHRQNEVTELQFDGIQCLEEFVHCADRFCITIDDEVNPLESLVKWCRDNEDSVNDDAVRKWEESPSGTPRNFHDKLMENKEEEEPAEDEGRRFKKAKSRRKRRRKQSIDAD